MSALGTPRASQVNWELEENDLPSLAAGAAVELGFLIGGYESDLTPLRLLSERMLQVLANRNGSEPPNALVAHAFRVVSSRAIHRIRFQTGDQPKMEELLREAANISEDLRSIGTDLRSMRSKGESWLAEMERFCLVLSKEASEYEHSLYGVSGSRHLWG